MVTFLLLTWILCATAELLWQQPMNSSDFSGWVADGNTVIYRSNDFNCPYNNKCWKMCGQLAGDWTSHLTRTTATSTIGKINTKLTFDIETTPFTNECSIEWSINNWKSANKIISKSFGNQNRQAQTVTFTGADNSTAVSIRVRVFEGDGDCCYISRFVLEADSIYSSAPTTQPTNTPTVPTQSPIGISVRVISDSWNDDYSISNPFKWQALSDANNPPVTSITPFIFTGDEGKYHGPYQSDSDGNINYATLWQQFRCDTYSMVDVSFISLICGTESIDYFEFYFNDSISSDGSVSLTPSASNWDSVTDSLISCTDPDTNMPEKHLFIYNNIAQVQATDIFEMKFFMRMDSDNEGLWINNISITCNEITPQPTNNPTAPTTAYPTATDGTSIRIIYNTWNDDYTTSNPFKWQALRSKQDPPTSTITPYIFTGNNNKQYHGAYKSGSTSDRYYTLLWQKFRCSQHSMIHVSFAVVICGTEEEDEFAFYFDDIISSDGIITLSTSVNAWSSVTDSAITCSSGSAEQNAYNYTNLREVQSSNDIFDVKFNIIADSTNEGIWITDVTIICDIIITNNPSIIPTDNPTQIHTNNPTITTINPTNDPSVDPTVDPTTVPTNTHTHIPSTQIPTSNSTDNPTLTDSRQVQDAINNKSVIQTDNRKRTKHATSTGFDYILYMIIGGSICMIMLIISCAAHILVSRRKITKLQRKMEMELQETNKGDININNTPQSTAIDISQTAQNNIDTSPLTLPHLPIENGKNKSTCSDCEFDSDHSTDSLYLFAAATDGNNETEGNIVTM